MGETIKKLGIVGAGFMGPQIASRAAIFGFDVSIFDIDSSALERGRQMLAYFTEEYFKRDCVKGDADLALKRVSFHDNLIDTVADSDLVIEAVTEDVVIKRKVFSSLDRVCKPHAIIGTNSSSIPVSWIEDAVERKEKVINIHFYSPIPDLHFVDIMRGTMTSDDTLEKTVEWVRDIECLPLVAKKECLGFVFNRVWHGARREALKSWAEGYADYMDIDRGWMLFTGMPLGPFGIMDYIGLDVVYKVQNMYYEETGDPSLKPPDALKDMVGRGELGMKSGKGFYTWPEPECLRPEFLSPKKHGK